MHKQVSDRFDNLPSWLTFSVRTPGLSLVIFFALIVLASWGLKALQFRGEYNIFFDEANPQLLAFKEIQARFSKTDSLAIVIAPEKQSVFTPKILKLISQLTQDAWQTPYSSRVDSLTNYQHTEAEEDDLLVQDLVPESFGYSKEEIKKVKNIALNDPETRNSIVSENGDVAIVNITVQLHDQNMTGDIVEVYNYVDHMLESYKNKYPDVRFYKAGLVAMNYSFMDAAQTDIMTLVPLMLIVILTFLLIMLRSLYSVLATLVVITCSVTATVGLAGWFGIAMNIASVNIPTLILTLAVADCVHIIATMRHQMSVGDGKNQAILHSLKMNMVPVIITSVTTAIGFFMMNMSDSPALRTFGSLALRNPLMI